MTDLPDLSDRAEVLRWARDVLRNQREWKSVASGREVIAIARRAVRQADEGVRGRRRRTNP